MSFICTALAIWAESFKDPVYIAINVAAFFVGWNLTKWWRALTSKPAENIGEQAREQYGDRQYVGDPELLRHDPRPKMHGPEYIAHNPDFNPYQAPLGDLGKMAFDMQISKQHWDRIFNRYYPSRTHDQDIPGEIKVVEGERISFEPLRIEHE